MIYIVVLIGGFIVMAGVAWLEHQLPYGAQQVLFGAIVGIALYRLFTAKKTTSN